MSDRVLKSTDQEKIRQWADAAAGIVGEYDNHPQNTRVVPEAMLLLATIAVELPKLLCAEEGHGWRAISTAPKDGTLLLLWCLDVPRGNQYVPDFRIARWAYGRWSSLQSRHHLTPTHWQPIPPPPRSPEPSIKDAE